MDANCYHLAQVNIARMKASLTDPIMAEFVAQLDEINAFADSHPGFIWRLKTDAGNATELRPYEDDRILFNLSVWKSAEQLKNYVYSNAHGDVMRKRKQWFEKFSGIYYALWWIKAGHIPTIAEAKERLAYLDERGETQYAFTFKQVFSSTQEYAKAIPIIDLDSTR
jgi:heme-degrading monooxygenase HmoA